MDLGVVGFDGLVGSQTGFDVNPLSSDPETKHKWHGSGFLKQERSEVELWKGSKMAKIDDTSKAMMLLEQRNNNNSFLLISNNNNNNNNHSGGGAGATTLFNGQQHQQQILSFSTPKSEPFWVDKASPNATLPYSFHPLSGYSRNAVYGSGDMHGAIRGPFTPSQWMELEHQALIYKYITANVPVPSHLLIPIRKALDSAAFCSFSTGLLRPNALGWGTFHLGFSNNTDPEPGRCRRTDGKKWRCSRDAVLDQKYCERHMNRGRHRSRKPVEGQNGHALTTSNTNTNTNTTNNNSSSKLLLPNGSSNNNNGNHFNGSPPSSSFSIVGLGSSASSNIITFGHSQELKNMHQQQQSLASDASAANGINRIFMNNNKENNASERRIMRDGPALPMLPPTLELKPKENPFMIHRKHQIPYEESSRINNEFGLVTSDSLLNPSHKSTTLLTSTRTFAPSHNSPDNKAESQHSLRNFIDDCPKMQSDRTQLSISIPMASSEFMPFTSSPTNEKLTLSPLRLSRELDPIQMGLGVGNGGVKESNSSTRQASWIPITWESSMCGPLGEVLNLSSNNNNNNSANDQCANNNKNSPSGLNLMSDGWENSPSIGSSPTGVLQKTSFGSLSNSSAGSSPRAENNKAYQEGASLCNDLLGSSTLGNASSSLPAL